MKRPLPVLDVHLLIEHGGHQVQLRGSGTRFSVIVPTLLSLFHYLRMSWAFRKRIPRQASVHVEWRGLRIPVRFAR